MVFVLWCAQYHCPDLVNILQPPTTSAEDVSAENRHIAQNHPQFSLVKSNDICWFVIHSLDVPYPPMTTPTIPWEQLDLRNDEDFQIPLPLPQHEARELREKLGQLEAKTNQRPQLNSDMGICWRMLQTGLWPVVIVTKNRYAWTLSPDDRIKELFKQVFKKKPEVVWP